MILADTSVWIDFTHEKAPELVQHLSNQNIVMHPFVMGELRCGHVKNRRQFFEGLENLQKIEEVDHRYVHDLIENNKLMGLGARFIDMHIISACKYYGLELLTRDNRMREIFHRLSN
ncbi:MAG: type II toxin-antitoxin system VapC family toxin [Bdellovibrionales bacterium]